MPRKWSQDRRDFAAARGALRKVGRLFAAGSYGVWGSCQEPGSSSALRQKPYLPIHQPTRSDPSTLAYVRLSAVAHEYDTLILPLVPTSNQPGGTTILNASIDWF